MSVFASEKAIAYGWKSLGAYQWKIVGVLLASFVPITAMVAIAYFMENRFKDSGSYGVVYLVGNLVSGIVGTVLSVGTTQFMLRFANHEGDQAFVMDLVPRSIQTVLRVIGARLLIGGMYVLVYASTGFVVAFMLATIQDANLVGPLAAMAVVLTGFLGLFILLGYCQAEYLIVDMDMGILDAMKNSAKIMRGNWLSYFAFGLICLLILAAGSLLLGVGLLWAIPLVMLAQAYVYAHLRSSLAVPAAE